jgi:hypothetical protein
MLIFLKRMEILPTTRMGVVIENLFQIYLSGMFFSSVLGIALGFVGFLVQRVTRHHIYQKNCEKLGMFQDPFTGRLSERPTTAGRYFSAYILTVLMSWIAVLHQLWTATIFIPSLFTLLRAKPPRIAELAFPLYQGTFIPTESVWARLYAMAVVSGALVPDKNVIASELRHYEAQLKDFDIAKALQFLRQLSLPELSSIDLDFESVFPSARKKTG